MRRIAAILAVFMLFLMGFAAPVLAVYKSHIRRPMHSKRHAIVTISLALLALGFSVLASNHVLAQDCTAVSGTTVTITTSCSNLDIGGDGSNVTINSGVTIDGDGTVTAVSTGDSTNATVTNNGTISVTTNRSFRTAGGQVDELINNGIITAGEREGLRNGGTIGTITNSGEISAGTDLGLFNNATGTITALTNSGEISAADDFGLQNRGIIGTITNSGTISADAQFGLHNFNSSSTITSLINTGTISAGTNNGLRNKGTIGTIINSGTISAGTADFGLFNDDTGIITALTNSGTISAGGNFAINNQGSIGTLTNTGSISQIQSTGISNAGTITTFNNLQGRENSNPVTFTKSLPTNYNIIVNGTEDFGQIVFSNVSGAINFGVDSSSTLEDVDTTYSTVLSGLSSSDISSGTSGTFSSGAITKTWTLDNSSPGLWDLNVTVINITSNTNTSVTTSVKPNVIQAINSLQTEANFANMNTYDCDLFGINNVCVSLGGRYTTITNPRTQVYSGVLTVGYKLLDNLRVSVFRHDNFSQKTPKSFKLSDKTPLLGALVVWNENANKLGYQLKLANTFQQKDVAVTREVVGSSEEGKGQTVMEAQSYVAELQYAHQLNDDTVFRHYFAVRRALIKQDGFTETGVSLPLSFNKIEDSSITVLFGLKVDWNLSTDIILKGSLGVEHDIRHSIDRLEPTGISGLTTVNLDESFNKTRPVVSIGLEYNLTPNQRLASTFQYQELSFKSKSESNVYLNYIIGF